jgi:PKD repeat protein
MWMQENNSINISAEFTFDATDLGFVFIITDPAPDATYEWSLGDGTVDTGGVSLTYEYELPGGYQVDVTAQNECGEDQFTTIVFDAPTISMPDQQGVIGQTLLVPVLIDGAYQAASFNMNLQFDSPGGSGTEFAIMDIYSTALQEEGPFAWFPVGVNETTVAWSANNFPGVTLQDGDTLFVLELLLFNPGVVPSILDNSEISFYTQDFVLVPLPVNADNGEITIGNGVSAVGDVVMAPYHEQAFQGLPEVGVFFNTDGSSQTEVTGSLGNYFIENLIPGSDYQVYFSRPGNADNGLSTLGILRLLRHLADIDPIDSPYQLIAADADCNEIVEIDDVFTIQDLILNFGEEENEDCPSWKFVDADYVFPNPADPFGYPEVFNLNAAEPVLDLGTTYGMKNGDVVGAANPNRISQLTDTLYLLANNGAFEEGELVEIDFTVAHFNELTGFQLELNFDPSILSFLEVETGAIPGFDIDDFGLTETANGRMRTNWFVSDLMPVSIDDGELAFRIRFTAEANISDVSEVLNLSLSEDFLPEAYNATFEQQALWLIFDAVDNVAEVLWSDGVQLFQNTPNPFTHQTKISFYLPEAMETVLVITDVMGRRVHQFKGRYSQGYHMLDWILEDNLSAGIYHYTLLTGTGQLTRRMVLVK